MRFPRREGHRETAAAVLEPRSLCLLTGAARSQWDHMIAPGGAARSSITLRTLMERSPRELTLETGSAPS
jgi:alkylated DNA repair dioxygenase AlkB